MTIRNPFPIIRRGFTLIELLVVIAIIVLLAGLMFPVLKSLTKSNTQAQAVNVIRAYLTTARNIALSQHRQAGVVFFEEDNMQQTENALPQYSYPFHPNQTAMQIFVADYNQTGVAPGQTRFVYYSQDRQYLPRNIRVAMLSDAVATGANVQTAENFAGPWTRAIVFDENGQLTLRSGLTTPLPGAVYSAAPPALGAANCPGTYPQAYGDWAFIGTSLNHNGAKVDVTAAASSPGFFVFDGAELGSQNFPATAAGDAARATWIKQHADVVIVNAYTGNVLR